MSDVAAVQDDNPARETRSVPLDCCGGLNNVDYSKMDLTLIEGLLKHTNFHDSSFYLAVVAIVFNPFFWNVVARWEHRTRTLSRLFGSPYLACYCLGFVIILLNVYRSHSMTVAMKSQTKWEVMDRTDVFYAGVALMVLGTVLVVGSFLALGFTGTFLDNDSDEHMCDSIAVMTVWQALVSRSGHKDDQLQVSYDRRRFATAGLFWSLP
ncbi:phosphatidylethanolamine N-methyltransferase isoform X4 [Anarrhichthys ocellatus]|uniref:phosphatidylethanolamine N-methyltransferase isoform X4 n=1 Tax=Anarrhichthys ocellatus TaxID=433405 RepID=UPI0012EDFED5|nr:phosphatidylethanolamine N-methyltransferase isoform X4 [Anarrhichthys ocellatus]